MGLHMHTFINHTFIMTNFFSSDELAPPEEEDHGNSDFINSIKLGYCVSRFRFRRTPQSDMARAFS